MEDPIVNEVRAIRHELARAHGFDIHKIMAAARARQERTKDREIVSFVRAPKATPRSRRSRAPVR